VFLTGEDLIHVVLGSNSTGLSFSFAAVQTAHRISNGLGIRKERVMLSHLRLQNFRSYRDSKVIHLGKLNIFLGPNNAGKSALMTAIQLALQSGSLRLRQQPLASENQAHFASFDSLAHRRLRSSAKRAPEFKLTFGWRLWSSKVTSVAVEGVFSFREAKDDGRAYVDRIDYRVTSNKGEAAFSVVKHQSSSREPSDIHYHLADGKYREREVLAFQSGIPYAEFIKPKNPMTKLAFAELRKARDLYRPSRTKTVVVMPHRPIPKTAYVLDDPTMSAADREIISHLVRIWTDSTGGNSELRDIIKRNLSLIGVAHDIEIVQPRVPGIKLVEVRVAAQRARQMLTIADVGYGVSQVLPLVSQDASLQNGHLMAYQPEMHLHPRAQSRLADLFVESTKRGNTIFVETHSPDLILRLQALVAVGAVRAEDVRVFCVEHDGAESMVTPLTFDRRGVPSPRWPRGFLDTSLDLAAELARARTA
jgi:predicted ATPase